MLVAKVALGAFRMVVFLSRDIPSERGFWIFGLSP
jgi:hypothetical protein